MEEEPNHTREEDKVCNDLDPDSDYKMPFGQYLPDVSGEEESKALGELLYTFEVLKMRVYKWDNVLQSGQMPKCDEEMLQKMQSGQVEERVKCWLEAFKLAGCPLVPDKYSEDETRGNALSIPRENRGNSRGKKNLVGLL